MPYAEPLEQAIRHCELVQVFLVDARRQRRARREWAESRGHLPPAATLRFVTWQDLFRLLREPSRSWRWAADLRDYLERLDLDTFEGIGRSSVSADDMRSVGRWRTYQRRPRLRQTMSPVPHGAPAALVRWRVPVRHTPSFGLRAAVLYVVGGSASRCIVAWRRASDRHRATTMAQAPTNERGGP